MEYFNYVLKLFEVFRVFELWIVPSPGESWAGVPPIPLDSPLGEVGASQLVSEVRFQIFVVYPRFKSLGCRTVGLV